MNCIMKDICSARCDDCLGYTNLDFNFPIPYNEYPEELHGVIK